MIHLDSGCACEKGGGFDRYLGGRHAGDASRGSGDGDVIIEITKRLSGPASPPYLKTKQPSLITVREAAKLQLVTDTNISCKGS